jgi:hypothetical protein
MKDIFQMQNSSVIMETTRNASRQQKHKDTSLLVFNAEKNALLVMILVNLARNQIMNVICNVQKMPREECVVLDGETASSTWKDLNFYH